MKEKLRTCYTHAGWKSLDASSSPFSAYWRWSVRFCRWYLYCTIEGATPPLSASGPKQRRQDGQSNIRSARALQTSTCSAIAKATSTSIPRYRTVLSILV